MQLRFPFELKSIPKKGRIIFITYFVIATTSSIYWAENFEIYTSFKGDYFFDLAEHLLVITYLLYLMLIFFCKLRKYLLLIILPIVTIFTSIFLGSVIILLLSINDFPRQEIYIYSIIYTLTAIFITKPLF